MFSPSSVLSLIMVAMDMVCFLAMRIYVLIGMIGEGWRWGQGGVQSTVGWNLTGHDKVKDDEQTDQHSQ